MAGLIAISCLMILVSYTPKQTASRLSQTRYTFYARPLGVPGFLQLRGGHSNDGESSQAEEVMDDAQAIQELREAGDSYPEMLDAEAAREREEPRDLEDLGDMVQQPPARVKGKGKKKKKKKKQAQAKEAEGGSDGDDGKEWRLLAASPQELARIDPQYYQSIVDLIGEPGDEAEAAAGAGEGDAKQEDSREVDGRGGYAMDDLLLAVRRRRKLIQEADPGFRTFLQSSGGEQELQACRIKPGSRDWELLRRYGSPDVVVPVDQPSVAAALAAAAPGQVLPPFQGCFLVLWLSGDFLPLVFSSSR